MALRAVKHLFTGLTTPIASYDSTKTNLGTLMTQKTGSNPHDKYVGPFPVAVARPMEESTTTAMMFPHVLTWSSTVDWVFLVENSAAAAAARRIYFYEYNKSTNIYNWRGFITATLNNATAHTIRGFRSFRYLHTSGSASASGTAVTGTSSNWQSERLAVGARIGFGSTDPTAISTWYVISAIGSNTSITLASTAGTVSDGPYVIEELRFAIVTTNATTTNGGVFVVKGVNYSDFITAGTTISASASTTDNLKLVYWLSDNAITTFPQTTPGAGTVTNITAGGIAVQSEVSKTVHYAYVIESLVGTMRIYRYNLRAADPLTGGKMYLVNTSGGIICTGTQAVTAAVSQSNNGRIGTLQHGPGAGVESLYFVTPTRIYRAALSQIFYMNPFWISDCRTEVPPGSANTFPATSVMASLEIADAMDRLIIFTTGATAFHHYVTRYPDSSGQQFDHIWGVDDKQQDQASMDGNAAIHFNTLSQAQSGWSENGVLHVINHGTTAALHRMYAMAFSAHWTYASTTNQRVISPEIFTPNCVSFDSVMVQSDTYVGGGELRLPTEPFRVYYRTSGITDNTGDWQALGDDGDLSASEGAPSIQFMFEFATIGWLCIPARILGLAVIYNDNTTDSHYQPSAGKSDAANKVFAWRFATAFGGTVPTLRIRLYDAVGGGLLLDDTTTASASGTWEKATDGSTFGAYNTSDKANETTYIRYTPTSLGDNIKVRALLTQN